MPSKSLAVIDPLSQGQADLGESVSFAREAIKRQLLLIILCILLGGLAAAVFTATQERTYTATASVQIEQRSADVVAPDAVNPTPPSADMERQLNTQLDTLRSRAMGARVARDLKLIGDKSFYDAMNLESAEWTAPGASSSKPLWDAVAQILSNNLTVTLPKDSRVATIAFTSGDPYVSAKIASSYAHNLISLNLERRFRSSDYARSYLNSQLMAARAELEKSQRQLNEYARAAGLLTGTGAAGSSSGSGSVAQSTLSQMNAALSDARAKRIEAQQRLQAARSSQLMSSPDVVNNPAVQRLVSDRATQEQLLSEARARYTNAHPSVVVAQARVNELNSQIQAAASAVRNSIEAEYRSAAGQEAALSREVGASKGQSLAEQDRSMTYEALRHDMENNRAQYDQLLQRQREVSNSAGVALNNISVLDEASAPAEPTSPRPRLNLIFGILLGLVIGIALAIARELLDDRVDGSDELERKLQLTSLGEIPLVRNLDQEGALQQLDDPDSALALAYTGCRTSLQFSTQDGLPGCFAITSSDAGEGKTTSAMGIARSLSNTGKRVLLIDGDLRRRVLTKWLRLNEEVGLSSLLTEQADLSEAIQDSGFQNLDVIAAGPQPPNPPDILDPERLRGLIQEANQDYDCIIIDAPPVATLADAPLLAAASEYVIFVIAAGTNHRGRAKATMRRLSATGATIIGGVITKVPSASFKVPLAYQYVRNRLGKSETREIQKAA
jgi:capsular exopolysaccharide synthesis family protein